LWEDIVSKIDNEFLSQSHRLMSSDYSGITIILHNGFYPKSIQESYDEVKKDKNISVLHIYTSLTSSAPTFGRHCDDVDVLIVQSIGKVAYMFDDNSKVEMNPGDSLFIPKGVYHNPIVSEPRVTLSFSWE